MKNLFLLLVIACFSLQASAQTNLDSLWVVWSDPSQPDTSRLKAMQEIAWNGYLFSKPDSAFYFAQMQYELAEKSGLKKQMAGALNTLGVSCLIRGDYPKALDYSQRSLKIDEEIGDKRGTAITLNNIGLIYGRQSNYPRALEYQKKSLVIKEELGDKKGIATSLNNIGLIYQNQSNYPRALEYHQKSLVIKEELGDKKGIAISMGNIGNVYWKQNNYPDAMEYYEKSLALYEELGNKQGAANSLTDFGVIYADQGNYPLAIDYCQRGLSVAEEMGELLLQKNACQCLYDTYKALGKGNEALVYLEKMRLVEDSLHTKETTKKLEQMEFAKVMLKDSIAKAEVARFVQEAHKEEVRKKNKSRNIFIGSSLFLLLLAGGLYSRWRYVRKAKDVISKERDRSENLLLNILPADIAAELKEKGKADARDFEMVSILFTDFKGFTEQSAKLSAADLVNEINVCFEAFDGIIEKYGIEKIKTIGDAYMAAGGLPVPTDDSVKNTVLAALEMQDFITARKAAKSAKGESAFEMRVGIHTGPVVAGIVGVKKFQYDIWGDTVNTASRMESSGEVGQVNISEATYELVKDASTPLGTPEFDFTPRGKVEAKGKGKLRMYFVSSV